MTTPATLIVTAVPNPTEMAAVQQYLSGVKPLLMEAGGQVVKRLKVENAVVGEPPYRMVLVMDFPDAAAVSELFDSDAYQALVPVRDRGFARMDVAITSGM